MKVVPTAAVSAFRQYHCRLPLVLTRASASTRPLALTRHPASTRPSALTRHPVSTRPSALTRPLALTRHPVSTRPSAAVHSQSSFQVSFRPLLPPCQQRASSGDAVSVCSRCQQCVRRPSERVAVLKVSQRRERCQRLSVPLPVAPGPALRVPSYVALASWVSQPAIPIPAAAHHLSVAECQLSAPAFLRYAGDGVSVRSRARSVFSVIGDLLAIRM